MADGTGRGVNDIETPFVFVRHGDPLPLDWMARHPGWVKFPATLVPRPTPQPVVPSAPWDASGAGEAVGFRPTSRPVSVGAPVVQRRRVPVHRLPTGTRGMDTKGAIDAYRQASETMDMAASTYLASVAGRSGMTERVPTSPVAAALDAHTPESDGPHHDHTHHGEAARQFGHSVSISEATASKSFVDAAKASSSLENTLLASEQSDKLSGLLELTSSATDPASTIKGWNKPASPNYQYAADDGTPGDISGWDLDYHGILERALEMFGK